MSYVEELRDAYFRFAALPWQQNLAPAQKVWMAMYPPEQERRVRLHLPDFEVATKKAGHPWVLVDVTFSFERWMAGHEYADQYFESPDLLEPGLPAFFSHLVAEVRAQLDKHREPEGVVALLGAGSLFGLGDAVKVSALVNSVSDAIAGRLLVFFPGVYEQDNYRLLDARDGWNYLATPITASEGEIRR